MKRAFSLILTALLGLFLYTEALALRLTDDRGKPISLDEPPKRIVSLAPSVTEILYAIGAEEQLVGITDFCPDPSGRKKRVGGFLNPRVGEILSLEPDLVIAFGGVQGRVAEELEARGLRVFLTYPRSLKDVLESFEEIGQLCGHPEEGRWLREAVSMRLEALRKTLGDVPEGERPGIFRVMGISPSQMGTLGGRSFQSDLYRAAGARNVFEDVPEDFFRVSLKEVEARRPDYLLVCLDGEERAGVLRAMASEGWGCLEAFREGRVLFLPCDLICRPGPRIAEAAFEIARALYPDRVGLPERIVSLVPSVTEDLFLLGAGEKVVGVSLYCSRVKGAEDLPKVGTILQANEESIIKLRPDLIFVSTLMPEGMLRRAEGLGIRVERIPEPTSFEELCRQFLRVGAIVGREREAVRILAEAKAALPDPQGGCSRHRVLVQVGSNPLYVAGSRSLIGDAVRMAGGRIAFEGFSKPVGLEEVFRVNPDTIVIVPMGFDGERERARWRRYPQLEAVRAGRLYILDPHLLCSPSPMSFVEAVERLRGILQEAGG